MTSRFITQIFNQNSTEASIYETIANHDATDPEDVYLNDLEERAGIHHDPGPSTRRDNIGPSTGAGRRFFPALSGPGPRRPPAYSDDDDHIDVPESLLFEHGEPEPETSRRSSREMPKARRRSDDTERGSDPRARRLSEQWNAATAPSFDPPASPLRKPNLRGPINVISPKDKALWKWANVENLDSFLQDVYLYFQGKGIFCILMSRVLNLMLVPILPEVLKVAC